MLWSLLRENLRRICEFSSLEHLLQKVEEGEIDPYSIELEKLIEDFRRKATEMPEECIFRPAGKFLLLSVRLMKLQLEYFFPDPKPEVKRSVRLQEAKEPLNAIEEDPLGEYFVMVGRRQGTLTQKQTSPEASENFELPLHRSFSLQEYARRLEELGLTDWESFKKFFYSLQDRVERVRFFVAWLYLF